MLAAWRFVRVSPRETLWSVRWFALAAGAMGAVLSALAPWFQNSPAGVQLVGMVAVGVALFALCLIPERRMLRELLAVVGARSRGPAADA